MLNVLRVFRFDNKVRLGVNADGGYVIANVPGYDCYVSAGVKDEESFSGDLIKKFKMNKFNSYAFDGTIVDYPYQYTKDITFIKKNIHSNLTQNTANLSHFITNFNNIFLKMDIEGCEYEWLMSLTENDLKKFKQIVIEFHGINDNTLGTSYENKIKCFRNLSNTHYIIHAHGNNHGGTSSENIPDVIEITYLRKDVFEDPPTFNTTELPVRGLDFPCKKNTPDLSLNFYPFVHKKPV